MTTHILVTMKNRGETNLDSVEYFVTLEKEKDNEVVAEGIATLTLSENSFYLDPKFMERLDFLFIDDSLITEALDNRSSSIFLNIIPQPTSEEKISALINKDISLIRDSLEEGDTSFLSSILLGETFIPYNDFSDIEIDLEFNKHFPNIRLTEDDINKIKEYLLLKQDEKLYDFSDNKILGAIHLLSKEDITIDALIVHYLNNIRFDKEVITKKELMATLDLDRKHHNEMVNFWLDDSKWTICDECFSICDSESEVRYKGYDFIFYEDRENIECLCDICFSSNEKNNNIERL